MSKNKDLENIFKKLMSKTNNKDGLVDMACSFFNVLLDKERDIFLEENNEDNKANGFYNRSLASSLGNLSLDVPRDRKGKLRSLFLPEKWQRVHPQYEDFITKLVLHCYSPNKIKSLLSSMNLPYSQEQIEEIKNDLLERANTFFKKELPQSPLALFIDGYHCSIKSEITKEANKAVVYVALGIDMDGNTDIYGFWTCFGNESKEQWMTNLNTVIGRGLQKPLLVISDDLAGIKDAIFTLFPKTDHQLCWTHFKRTARKNLKKDDYNFFKELLDKVKFSNFEEATKEVKEHLASLEEEYPNFVEHHLDRIDNYFTFLKYPKSIQSLLYTTNKVESFNSMIEKLRINSGGYFQSMNTLLLVIYVTITNLKKSKWKNTNKKIVGVQYEINQIFHSKFHSQTQGLG